MKLTSGGIIANYKCNAACGHCMYGSSPAAERGYMTVEMATRICDTLRRHGCTSVHIGGGEPFLQPDDLATLVRVILQSGLGLDYIETNAGWLTDDETRNRAILQKVLDAGCDCIMVSADPFHIEFVPLQKPLALLRLLRETGTSYFVWKDQYLRELSTLDITKTYSPAELTQILGYDATLACAQEYGMGFNGRALNLLRQFGAHKPADAYLTDKPCDALRDTGHFHIDYLGQYVPPRCTGLGIAIEDLGKALDPEEYPILSRLYAGGLQALYEYAQANGFVANNTGYVSSCDLCFAMRKAIAQNAKNHDLTPRAFYEQNF